MSDKNCVCERRFRANDFDLLHGRLSGRNTADLELLNLVFNLGGPTAGDDQDPIEKMLWPKVRNESPAMPSASYQITRLAQLGYRTHSGSFR